MDPSATEDLFRTFLLESDSTREQQIAEILEAVHYVVNNTDMFPDVDERGDATRRITEHLSHLEGVSSSNPGQVFSLPPKYRELKCYIRRNDISNLRAVIKTLYEESLKDVNKARYDQWKAQFETGNALLNENPPDPNLHTQSSLHAPDYAVVTRERAVQLGNATMKWMIRQVYKIPQYFRPAEVTTTLDEVLATVGSNWGQFFTTLGISLGAAGVIAVYNLYCVKTGRRSLERAKKNIIDNGATIVVGNLAGYASHALLQGSLTAVFGPFGFWLGLGVSLVVGFVVGGLTRRIVSNWTSKHYQIPQLEDLEKAYNTLGLSKNATDYDLSKACREKCRPLHPDNLHRSEAQLTDEEIDAKVQEFIDIQNAYKFIKTMREADEAGKDIHEQNTWQESFMLFVKNLFSIRRREFPREEELMKAINFEVIGFPPSEIFEEPTVTRARNTDLDAPLTTIGMATGSQEYNIANRWWERFWAKVGNQ